ncbi:hypothetical protein M0D21_00225 [Aquimarina sp. D1M17]|uniref:hypothetical protein n=1 Tax=Aquimarina acroporae TaxID=2937283 RepID=UPI0020BFE314|nr:hypothetical protein [Aquimarina acroporae]MCK8519974.1 hypothetical protein [Aquimarina acroporae]
MIVWSGRGYLTVVVLAVILFGLTSVLPKEQTNLSYAISLFASAIFSWFMGKKWNESNLKTMVDKNTGEEFILKPNHSLFWIKMQYWGIIFGILGIVMLVKQFS